MATVKKATKATRRTPATKRPAPVEAHIEEPMTEQLPDNLPELAASTAASEPAAASVPEAVVVPNDLPDHFTPAKAGLHVECHPGYVATFHGSNANALRKMRAMGITPVTKDCPYIPPVELARLISSPETGFLMDGDNYVGIEKTSHYDERQAEKLAMARRMSGAVKGDGDSGLTFKKVSAVKERVIAQ